MNDGRSYVCRSRHGHSLGSFQEHSGAVDHFLEGTAGLGLGFQKFLVRLRRLLLKGLDRFQSCLDNGQRFIHVGTRRRT